MTTPADPRDVDAQGYLRTSFLERIAHELRGPAGVTGQALDEIERALGPQADQVRPFFAMAKRGILRILRSAERLQRTAHFEAHREGASAGPSDLREIVAKAARDAEKIEARRQVRVEVVTCERPCLVMADSPSLAVAIEELVVNAIQFARAVVRVELGSADSEASVVILDDGPGFGGPAPRRFEPPFPRKGLGLSLPLVCDIIEAHAGKVSFQDRKGEGGESGTRVTVALKLHSPGR